MWIQRWALKMEVYGIGLTKKWLSLHWAYLVGHNSDIQKEDAGSNSVFQLLSFRGRSSTSGYIFWVWITFASLKICVLSWETSYSLFLWQDIELSFSCWLELKVGDREASCGLNSMKQLEARPCTCLELITRYTGSTQTRQWQPTPVFLPGESQGRGSLVGCHLWGRTESDTTDAT